MANLSQLVQEDDRSKKELIAINKANAEVSGEVRNKKMTKLSQLVQEDDGRMNADCSSQGHY